jgi:hypothetical protein
MVLLASPCCRHGLVGGPTGPGSTNPSPSGRSRAVPPAELPPAVPSASRQPLRPLLGGPGGASSSPWPAIAGPAPPPTARCRVPNTADQHGCRTAARSCGRPDSANRRSGGCTDVGRRAWANTYRCGPCRSPSREGWRSPRAGGSSRRSPGVTALGRVAGLRPTHQAGGHGQLGAASRFHRTPTAGRARRIGSGCGRRPQPQRPPPSPPWRSRSPGDEPPSGVGRTRPATGSWMGRCGRDLACRH